MSVPSTGALSILSLPTVAAWERTRPASIQMQRDEFGQNSIIVLIYPRRRYYFNRGLRGVKSLLEDASSGYFRGSVWQRGQRDGEAKP